MEINPEQGSLHGDAVEISKPTMSNLAVSGVTNLPRFETFLWLCLRASQQAGRRRNSQGRS
jgi:hypothetical protein